MITLTKVTPFCKAELIPTLLKYHAEGTHHDTTPGHTVPIHWRHTPQKLIIVTGRASVM